MKQNKIFIVDCGGQFSQMIARRVREAKVYCEVLPHYSIMEAIKKDMPSGMIVTGGPNSIFSPDAPTLPKEFFQINIPVLGICYGAHLMANVLGGKVKKSNQMVQGQVNLYQGSQQKDKLCKQESLLYTGVEKQSLCWMNHKDQIEIVPDGFCVSAYTENCLVASMEDQNKKLYGVQYFPENHNTLFGQKLLENFLYRICGCSQDWTAESFIENKINEIRESVGDRKVLCGLSGGVDSSVAAVLVHKAIGNNLICVLVDHGLLRKDEADQVEEVFGKQFNMKLIRVNAQQRFLKKLAGVTDPEQKRKVIGEEFIRVFETEAAKLQREEGRIDFLLQGTIYPDIIESDTGDGTVIKSHHNVGGLPEDVDFELLEPIRLLFKDEVRRVGEALGIDTEQVWRQPFPGPGLAVRCLGEVNEEKLAILREADYILRDEIKKAGLDREIWQYFTILPNIKSVGVTGDNRTYDHTIAIRAIKSVDGMTADWVHIPYEVLEKISKRIVNEVKGVNRIVYDITSKPPATIEWE